LPKEKVFKIVYHEHLKHSDPLLLFKIYSTQLLQQQLAKKFPSLQNHFACKAKIGLKLIDKRKPKPDPNPPDPKISARLTTLGCTKNFAQHRL